MCSHIVISTQLAPTSTCGAALLCFLVDTFVLSRILKKTDDSCKKTTFDSCILASMAIRHEAHMSWQLAEI